MNAQFAEFRKRIHSRALLAITLESGRIVVGLVRSEGEQSKVTKSFQVEHGAEAVLADATTVGRDLAAQLEVAGIQERRCVVCVPASWALTTSTDVPNLAGEDLRGFLELRAEREFPMSAGELKLAHCSYELPDGTLRATLAAIPTKRIEAVEAILAVANLRAVSISLGLDSCLPKHGAPGALHFVANGTHVDLVIAAGGGIAGIRSLPTVRVPAAAAETEAFARELRITLGRLPEPVRQQLREAQFSGAPVAAEALSRELRQPLQRMGIEPRTPMIQSAEDPFGGAAIFSAKSRLQQQPVAFEFLPPQVSKWQNTLQRFDSKRRRMLVVAGVALLLLPIIAFFIRGRIESSLTAEWAGMRSNVEHLESLQHQIRKFRPWFEAKPNTVHILEGLVTAFPEQGDVWAKSVQYGENSRVTCSGYARTQSAMMSFLDRLRARSDVTELQVQQVRGDNPVQFTVTYKWEGRDAK